MAESLSQIFQLLRPGIHQMEGMFCRQGEEIDMYLDNMRDQIIARYVLFGKPTGDTGVVCDGYDIRDRSYVHHFRSRIINLLHQGRERFVVRRFVLADIEKPTRSERAQYVATRPLKRGKFKRTNNQHLPVVRIPRLLSVSPLA